MSDSAEARAVREAMNAARQMRSVLLLVAEHPETPEKWLALVRSLLRTTTPYA